MAESTGRDLLSCGVEIKGVIKVQRELLIDGRVEGEIHSDGGLTIGENGDIRAEIKSKSITVYGKVRGNITATERCELKSGATLEGDLKAARLAVEEGATFIGKSEVWPAVQFFETLGLGSSDIGSLTPPLEVALQTPCRSVAIEE